MGYLGYKAVVVHRDTDEGLEEVYHTTRVADGRLLEMGNEKETGIFLRDGGLYDVTHSTGGLILEKPTRLFSVQVEREGTRGRKGLPDEDVKYSGLGPQGMEKYLSRWSVYARRRGDMQHQPTNGCGKVRMGCYFVQKIDNRAGW